MIYITTFGGGVWHGAASGDKRRPDIATPKLAPGEQDLLRYEPNDKGGSGPE
jgi:hypothetical protein